MVNTDNIDNIENKKIAKNTFFLYIRMFVIMTISFFTTRIVLDHLGVNDYGIYNVVGGVVGMFAIVTPALTSAIMRFITYEIGLGKQEDINKTFSSTICILLIISLVFIIIAEPCGIWFINNKMKISYERLGAAHWVFQCSLITFVINLISIPYNALIVAYERMQAFAYISLIEACLKLMIAFTLMIPHLDSLKIYSLLLSLVAISIRLIYGFYASKSFPNVHFKFLLDKRKFKEILQFTGWTCIGGSASILNNQGVDILLNIFWGTAVNAARGIAMQVNSAVTNFTSNFMMAVNPQIIKTYASDNLMRTEFLVIQSARLSVLLILLISAPILAETKQLLKIWLTIVPEDAVIFVKFILIQTIIESISFPLQTLNQASGKIMIYQIAAGGVLLLNFPLSYVLLKLGYAPICVYFSAIFISVMVLIVRLVVLHALIKFDSLKFFNAVIWKSLIITVLVITIPYFLSLLLNYNQWSWIGNVIFSFIWGALIEFFIGLNKQEKIFILSRVQYLYNRLSK